MVDIETMSQNINNGMIVSIAIKSFERTGKDPVSPIKRVWYIDMDDSERFSRKKSEETIRWWMEHPDAYAELYAHRHERQGFREVMCDLYNLLVVLHLKYELYVWSKGIDFDFPMLESSFRAAGIKGDVPYDYWRKRDVRSVVSAFEMLGYQQERKDAAHDAISDVEQQIREVQEPIKWFTQHYGYVVKSLTPALP